MSSKKESKSIKKVKNEEKKVKKSNVSSIKKEDKNNQNKKKNLKKISVIILLVTLLCILSIYGIYSYTDYKIYKLAVNSKDNIFEYETKYSKIYLKSKTINYIKENELEANIIYENYTVTLNNKNINKVIDLSVSLKIQNEIKYEQIDEIKHIYINEFDFDALSIDISKYDFLENKDIVDIYLINKDNDLEYYETVNINKNTIDINYNEEAKSYIIIYIAPESYEIETTNFEVGEEVKLNISVIPENATDKTYKLEYDEEYFIIEEEMLNPIKEGNITLSILNEKNDIKTDVEIIINNYVKEINVSSSNITLYVGNTSSLTYELVPSNAENKNDIKIVSSDEKVVVYEDDKIKAVGIGTAKVTISTTSGTEISKVINVTVKEVVQTPTVSGIKYIDGILIVNKTYALPSTYAPGLSSALSSAFSTMKTAASKENLSLVITSGYRSYTLQDSIYNNYVKRDGQEEADTYSARPGHSEHQSGLGIDVANYTNEWDWLAKNAHKYGFIVRYPEGKEHITGYMYEPWHLRYLGVDVATKVYNSGLCLEEYLNITSVYAN
ncbi:MAG: D-alanyl-D-alanine carboxypeptidase family protein [bacterium]